MYDYYIIRGVQMQLSTNGSLHSAGYFQERMSALMENLEFLRVYFNDFLIIKYVSFEDNLAKVEEITKRLQSDGIKYNIDKWKFAVLKVEYLGYIITQEFINQNQKK